MKSKTLEREYDEFETRLKQLRKKNEHIPEEHIRLLIRSLQQLKQELHLPEKHQRIRTGGDVSETTFNRTKSASIFFSRRIKRKKSKSKLTSFGNE